MSQFKVINKQSLPTELRQLPIFQVIRDEIPAAMKTPEAKKKASTLVFWAMLIALSIFFFTSLPTLIEYAKMGLLFVLYAIIMIVLILLAPKIIRFLHWMGRITLFKAERQSVRNNPIETLRLLEDEAKNAYDSAGEKLTQVEGIEEEFRQSATESTNQAKKLASQVQTLYAQITKAEDEIAKLLQDGRKEEARSKERFISETQTTASMRIQESEAEKENAQFLIQAANETAKVVEILKDNRSAARIYQNATSTSIRILEKKLSLTNKLKSASEGLAEVYQMKDQWKFVEAFSAASGIISYNIASIRSNIRYLNESAALNVGAKASKQDIANFVANMQSGNNALSKINVQEMTQADYNLSTEEKGNQHFNILD